MKRLMVFFLLILFLLPFPAEGSDTLKIGNKYFSEISKDSGYIIFYVRLKQYTGYLFEFGFDVIYDSNILEYVKHADGDLNQDNRYSFIDVTRIDDHTLRVNANSGYHIASFYYDSSDPLLKLFFSVKKYEETTLRLANLQGDFRNYETEDGSFLKGESYYSQSPLLGLGYPGLPFSQGYPFLNPLVPINNPYQYLYPSTPTPVINYVSPGVFSYPYQNQSSPYSLWQPFKL